MRDSRLRARRPPAHPRLEWSNLSGPPAANAWGSLPDSNRVHMTYSGRAAIRQYLARLRQQASARTAARTVVLVPAFHCPTVVDPVLDAGYEVRYYGIDETLNVATEDFLRKLDRSVAAAIFIRYFGMMRTDASLFAACRDAGAVVIEDCCHSFLSANPLRLADAGADATVYSFWKLLPSRVGGGALVRDTTPGPSWPRRGRARTGDSLLHLRTLASQLCDSPIERARRLLDRRPVALACQPVPAIRKPAAEAYPYDPDAATWGIPLTSRFILGRADLAAVVDARRRNYESLAARLVATDRFTPLRRGLPAEACPWGFPLLLARRAERDYLLRAQGVPLFTFGEVLHPSLHALHPGERRMLETAVYLANSLLVLSIHQGIEQAHIERYAAIVNEFILQLGSAPPAELH